jgi:long-chain acyl-CoA synthetase
VQKDRSPINRILARRQRHGQASPAVFVTTRQREISAMSWGELVAQARRFGLGLNALGVERGQVVGLVSRSGPECIIAILGALLVGVGVADLGDGNDTEVLLECFRRANCRLAICGDREKIEILAPSVRQQWGERAIIGWGAASSVNGVFPFGQICLKGGELFDREPVRANLLISHVELNDVALVLPDSRRDGSMREVRLSHDNCVVSAESLRKSIGVTTADRLLRLGESRGLVQSTLLALLSALTGASMIHDLGELGPLTLAQTAHPTVLLADSDVLDAIYRELEREIWVGAAWRRSIGGWARRVGNEAARRRISGTESGPIFTIGYLLADRLVLSELRRLLGGQIRRIIAYAPGMRRQTRWFFESIGLSPLCFVGIAESCGIGLLELPEDPRPGSYGRAMPGVDVWVDADGRLRIRGANVAHGVPNVDVRGWLDLEIFCEIDDEGMIWPESPLGALDAPSLAVLPIAERSENRG